MRILNKLAAYIRDDASYSMQILDSGKLPIRKCVYNTHLWFIANKYIGNCKFQHPESARPANNNNNNRFGALQGSDNNSRNSNFQNRNNGYQNQRATDLYTNSRFSRWQEEASQAAREALPYQLDKAAIKVDLSSERPQWILSAYGPGRYAPVQLFGGEQREKSFEEMRLYHYQARAANAEQQAVGFTSGESIHKLTSV